MDNPGLPEALWSHLDRRLWHATARDGLHGIIADKEIGVAVCDRYVGSFSRNQGGVSLFDFGPASEDVPNQFHNWCGWFGQQQCTRVAVWLEIDRASVLENLLDAEQTRKAWHRMIDQRLAESRMDEPRTLFIPGVEACRIGPIPLAAVAGVLLIDQHNRDLIRRLGKPDDNTFREIDAFEESLPPHEDDPVVQALSAGRQRALAKHSED